MGSWVRSALLSLAALVALPAASQPAPSTVDQLKAYQADLRRDKAAGDWAAYLVDAGRLSALVNGSPQQAHRPPNRRAWVTCGLIGGNSMRS